MRFWELDYWTNSKRYTHTNARDYQGYIRTNQILGAGGTKYGSMDRSALLELEGTKYEVQIRLWELEGYSTKLRYKLDSEIWELEPRGSVHNIDKIGGTNHSVQCKINLSHSEAATVHVLGKYTRTCYYRTCGILRADFEGRQNPRGV